MDLFQTLRRIQKKERDNGTLARVDEDFYNQIHIYLNELKQSAMDDPFSDVYNTLNEARRIATEICEKREHKITQTAVLNINRSYDVFSNNKDFDLIDSMPLNLTPEEETFYFSLIETLKNHKFSLSGINAPKPHPSHEFGNENDDSPENETQEQTADLKDSPSNISAPEPVEDSNDLPDNGKKAEQAIHEKPKFENTSNNLSDMADKTLNSSNNDEVLDRLNEISNAKVITDEAPKPIEKQISKSKPFNKKIIPEEFGDIKILDDDSQFVDLDDPKRMRESEIVTILVLDEIASIMGIDEKVYGPFRSQDIVMLPKINANIFVKNRKARFVNI